VAEGVELENRAPDSRYSVTPTWPVEGKGAAGATKPDSIVSLRLDCDPARPREQASCRTSSLGKAARQFPSTPMTAEAAMTADAKSHPGARAGRRGASSLPIFRMAPRRFRLLRAVLLSSDQKSRPRAPSLLPTPF
jgi:hypothetical protein